MRLSDVGESRVRAYLYVLERSLRTFLPRDVVADAVCEVESHIRERVAQADSSTDERTALERVLGELGPPLQVARAYSLEMTVDEAVATGRVVPLARALWHMATTTAGGFFAMVLVMWGYLSGAMFLVMAALEPFFPEHIVFRVWPPIVRFSYPAPPTGPDPGGFQVIPFALACGVGILAGTHRGARQWLAWWINRRRAMRLRLIGVASPLQRS